MAEYAFFAKKADRWGKDMASLWGNFNICPQLHWLELPCHSQAELFSISSLKVWGVHKNPTATLLLVWVEDVKRDRCYSISLVWVHPNQVRAATMEEAVDKLTAFTSSGANWSYALAQLCNDPHHAPLPKNKHLGVLPWGKAQETFSGWISQLEVYQLLAASPQVVYPIGLNGYDELIITTLPEPLDSSISLMTSEHIYLGIDIPSPPDKKMPPLKDIPTILVTSPPKSEGSMTIEVSNLLSRAVLEASSCESQHSSQRRPTTAVIFMSPPQKPEDLPWPADTSSQASIDEGEASLEDVPSNISPIAASSRSGSISPRVDLVELWTNANKALDDLLSTKGSIDARRQRAVCELGMMLCQNESQVATMIKEAIVICSQTTLDIRTACSQSLLKAKTSYLAVVKEAKTTRGHLVQEAKATCSKAICEAEVLKISQAAMLHKEHGKYMRDL